MSFKNALSSALLLGATCLALAACGKKMEVGSKLPGGFVIKEITDYHTLDECIEHAKKETDDMAVQNLKENKQGTSFYTATGNINTNDELLILCNAPDPHETHTVFTQAVKSGQ